MKKSGYREAEKLTLDYPPGTWQSWDLNPGACLFNYR